MMLSRRVLQLCSEIEKKAVLVREQQGEYDRVQAAYVQMTAALENAAHEKRHSEALILDLEAQIRQDDKQAGFVLCFVQLCMLPRQGLGFKLILDVMQSMSSAAQCCRTGTNP